MKKEDSITSNDFYKVHGQRYSEVQHGFIQSVYTDSSHSSLKDDSDIIKRMQEIISRGSYGLDAGCGAGARDVFFYWQAGYDIYGIDALEENISLSKGLHPEIASRLSVADLSESLTYRDGEFDFIICNAVIQHIKPKQVHDVTLPEFSRILKSGAILQLMFKVGKGIKTIYDRDYEVTRTFQLYDIDEIVALLSTLDLKLIEGIEGKLGGVMYFTDSKPVDHCLVFMQKQ